MRATAASLESLIKAQGNLEHWRRSLIAKLSGAIGFALQRVAGNASSTATDGAPCGPDKAAIHCDGRNGALPPELSSCLTRVVALIEDVAAQTSLIGLRASLHGVLLVGGAIPDPARSPAPDERNASAEPPFSPSEVLAAAAAAAEAVTERVGTTISEVNALAQRPDRDRRQTTADIAQMVAQLADQLAAIRDGNWQRLGYVG